jgi:Tat protein translocase TatB subunit
MLDIAWSEMLLIAVVAIVVIGPKELPYALRAVGRWVAKARSLAREFQNSVDDMIAETELQDLRDTANSIKNFDPDDYVNKQTDPTGKDDDGWEPKILESSENDVDDEADDYDATDDELDEYENANVPFGSGTEPPSYIDPVNTAEDFTPPAEDDESDGLVPERSKEA